MNLRKKVLKGFKWTISSAIVQAVLQLLKLGLITRLLSPEDFGLMAIVILILGIGELFKDLGMSAAIIHKQDITSEQLSSLYWLNVLLGLVLFFIITLLSWPLSLFFENPALLLLISFSALAMFFQSFGQQYSVLFRKELEFNILESISLVVKLIDFIVVVTLAFLDYGVWALVYAQVLSSIVSSVLFVMFGKHIYSPNFYFRINDVKPFFSFGLYQMGGQIINYLNSNLDKIILGKFFSIEILGFYNLAWQLIQYPKNRINPIITKITFPLFSKIHYQSGQLEKQYSFMIRSLILLIVPIYLFLGVFASDIVFILFGEGWELSIQLIQVLVVFGILKTIANPGGTVFLALGRADVEFWWNVFWIVFSTITLLLCMITWPDVLTLVYVLVIITSFGSLVWHYLIYTVAHISYKEIIESLFKSFFIACSVLLFVSEIIKPLLLVDHVFLRFCIISFLFTVLYVWSIFKIDTELVRKITLLIKDLLFSKKT